MQTMQNKRTPMAFPLLASALLALFLLSGCAPLPASLTNAGSSAPLGNSATAPTDHAAEESAVAAPSAHPAPTRSDGAAAASRPPRQTRPEPVTAGVVDDNEQWSDYLDYLDRHTWVNAHKVDVRARYVIQVVDENGRAVHDARVTIAGDEDTISFVGRTGAGGQVLFFPMARQEWVGQESAIHRQSQEYRVTATKGLVARRQTFTREDGDQWQLVLETVVEPAQAQLDLLFLVDATGSMDDEIDKLKASMTEIAAALNRLPEMPDVRYGLVAYRDQGDAFVVRTTEFTNLHQFQRVLVELQADGGGDEPEALNQALHSAIHNVSWRQADTVRMILLVADAPPHLDYDWEPFTYAQDMFEAVARGIKIFPVGASGLGDDGEYIFRQLAQVTGGKFVFLTYADGSDPSSGPGSETDHDVENYSVNTLDRLVVRLVREELAKLSAVVEQQAGHSPPPDPQRQNAGVPVVSCVVHLIGEAAKQPSDCYEFYGDAVMEDVPNLMRITLDPVQTGYTRARLDITYTGAPIGYSVNITHRISDDGFPYGYHKNDSEIQVLDSDVLVLAGDDAREIWGREHLVLPDGHLSLEIAVGTVRVEWAEGMELIESPGLFPLSGPSDGERPGNYSIYAAFNRTVAADRKGIGVAEVRLTLYP
ncbi:MAG: VWA domain-containing protein [Caldilineaceae bacterium]|nr:VWA domain-containing protein [Caldilineaceae bacterium]